MGRGTPEDWQQRGEAEVRQRLALEAEGFVVESLGGVGPFQMWGRVPSGESFYFRCRHETCLLAIGGDDPSDYGEWEGKAEIEGGEFAASWIEPDDAIGVFRGLVSKWESSR